MNGEWDGFNLGYILYITLLGANPSLSDHEFSPQGVFPTEQACRVAAAQIGEAELKLARKYKEEWKDARYEFLCVPNHSKEK